MATLFVIPPHAFLRKQEWGESFLKKDSGPCLPAGRQARMTNGQAGIKDYKNPPLSPFFKGGLYNPLFGKEGLGRFYKYVFSGQALNKFYAVIRRSCHV